MATKLSEFGTVQPPKTMYLRQFVGTAEDADGSVFELSADVGQKTPIVMSKQTGNYFTLSWQDLINLAVERGIEKELKEEEASV